MQTNDVSKALSHRPICSTSLLPSIPSLRPHSLFTLNESGLLCLASLLSRYRLRLWKRSAALSLIRAKEADGVVVNARERNRFPIGLFSSTLYPTPRPTHLETKQRRLVSYLSASSFFVHLLDSTLPCIFLLSFDRSYVFLLHFQYMLTTTRKKKESTRRVFFA